MTLDTNLRNFATDIATNHKAMKTLINGNTADLSALTTTQKSNLVAAINEVAAAVGGAGAVIDDGALSALTVWSSSKTNTEIQEAVASIIDGAPELLDTLNELAAAIGDDPNFAATIAAQIGGKANAVHTHAAADIASGTIAAARLPIATDVATGIVELATVAEAIAGTDTALAVTPAGLKGVADTKAPIAHVHAAGDVTSGTFLPARLPAATETAIGAVEIATVAEVAAGTDNVRAVTALGIAGTVGPTDTNYVNIFRAGLA